MLLLDAEANRLILNDDNDDSDGDGNDDDLADWGYVPLAEWYKALTPGARATPRVHRTRLVKARQLRPYASGHLSL